MTNVLKKLKINFSISKSSKFTTIENFKVNTNKLYGFLFHTKLINLGKVEKKLLQIILSKYKNVQKLIKNKFTKRKIEVFSESK